MKKPLIIGIGNRFRGDDAIGILVAEELKTRLEDKVDIEICKSDMIDLMDLWRSREAAFLIDAVTTGQQPIGFIHRFAAHQESIPAHSYNASTHLFDTAQVIELAKALDRAPASLILYGIESEDFSIDTQVSSPLADKVDAIVDEITADIRKKIPL